ncbi:class III poly(R)-hydroxyalkanoic acid synthase subunit PhaE [Xanthomonas translucens pv. translucens]|uniref:class III poly(R)-hydroxyalkanoic acid synthase subunit PhaE n=2 Tax=Xanthomonas campestris pv. translucens TaxID=343 RepID=UPI001F30C67A|nr:class III poly(R)-hydroxyalkanoic acid synthase subunit PhaE [Xanthomonas translucens]MCS3360166.1 class III poly(R)-hydroxyalkanoic acid synthase subunit PhaE [Xanthomonas translucens pv. translucens]MCS3373250.1 class III poly(R)-hydroxyalkanoic acid synthase subunit PhaE [Xanthomonas translucens pv. translucens]MCT8289695.1 class III poly(R)-hydroxyalkanoic acid synthase subunit PhaE [Xanthomonas translucens pv. translucens]MCT8293423.1 class III poly(R)-hydroxyalkanoic acid synthase subu
MKASGGSGAGDFEALARQYWGAWSDALRQGGGAAAQAPADGAGHSSWREAIDTWAQWLPRGTAAQAEDAVSQLQQQAGEWFGAMQQVAAQFAGRDASSADIADAWKQQVQGQREQMLQWLIGTARGAGQAGMDPWLQQATHWLQGWQRDSGPWLQMPGFGPGRNHHARWRALAKAQQEYQAQLQAYLGQLQGAIDRAFGVFEAKLREHEDPGRQLTNARAMFDLWIDAAEEAYAASALSEEFREVYAGFANAQMRLRALLQRETEQLCEQLGLPTRTELDAAHRHIADLERRLRRLERGAAPAAAAAPSETTAGGKAAPRSPSRSRPAAAAPSEATATGARAKAAAKPSGARAASTPKPPAKPKPVAKSKSRANVKPKPVTKPKPAAVKPARGKSGAAPRRSRA